MSGRLDFYFDFSSPYAYLGAQRIEGVAAAHGRTVDWRPFLLGAVFKTTGQKPLVDIPVKGDYARHDLPRSARRLGCPFVWPERFPFISLSACRAYYWLKGKHPEAAGGFAKALLDAAFGEGRDISGNAEVVEVAVSRGLDREEVELAMKDSEVKEKLRHEVDDAISRGVFGSPFIFVDEEPFWGADRLDEVDEWLRRGGW